MTYDGADWRQQLLIVCTSKSRESLLFLDLVPMKKLRQINIVKGDSPSPRKWMFEKYRVEDVPCWTNLESNCERLSENIFLHGVVR